MSVTAQGRGMWLLSAHPFITWLTPSSIKRFHLPVRADHKERPLTTAAVILNIEKISHKTEVEKFTKGQPFIWINETIPCHSRVFP